MTSHVLGRVLAVAVSLLLVAYGAVTLASLLARETQTRTATYQGITTIELDTSFESVEITAQPGAGAVDLERRWSWSLGKPSVTTRREGDRLVVRSSCPFWPGLPCTGDVTLTVPPEVLVVGDASDGHLLLDGLTSAVDVHTADGRLDLRDLSGTLRLATRDGSVRATGLASDTVSLDSADGSVRLGFAKPPTTVRATTRDGSVEVLVPDDGTAYAVSVDVADGSQDVGVPTDPDSASRLTVRTRDGSVRIGTGD